jgi:hypothetical protein
MKVQIGKGIELEVDPAALPGSWDDPTTPKGHIVYIGLRNVLMDSHAGIKGADAVERSRDKAAAKLTALMAGITRQPSPFKRVDPAAKAKLMRAVAEVWEEDLAELSKIPSKKRDAEALKRARARLANGIAPEPRPRKKAA